MGDFLEILVDIIIATPFVVLGFLVILGIIRCIFNPKLWRVAFRKKGSGKDETLSERDMKHWLSGVADPGVRASFGDTDDK